MRPAPRPDVIVVGAGSAGCIVSRRLVDAGASVMLVEAGPGYPVVDGRSAPPSGIAGDSFFDALREPGWQWDDLMASRVHGRDESPYARGRGVGGSSAVNAMLALWGEPDDYDRWERDHACEGWSWSDVEPIFRRLAVPLRREERLDPSRLGGALVTACRREGWPDHVGPRPLGSLERDAGLASLTRFESGRRASAFDIFVLPIATDPRLQIRVDSMVESVVVDGGIARGVQLTDGSLVEAGTVVVCAGAVHSPWLLQRSGIENPMIGRGVQDHASAPFTIVLKTSIPSSALAVDSVARFSSGQSPADLQLLPIDHLGPDAPGLGSLSVALMDVHSRGTSSQGRLDFNMLSDERDLAALVVGVRTLRQLLDSPALRDVVEMVYIDDIGTPLDALGDDVESLRDWLLSRTGDYVHASGGCVMGPRDRAVVDTRGRSWDVEALWVVDASVMPRLPRANTHLPTCMIAERMSTHLVASLA
jgi:5-(hydroxymethyl)furfural/furfural oxidase